MPGNNLLVPTAAAPQPKKAAASINNNGKSELKRKPTEADLAGMEAGMGERIQLRDWRKELTMLTVAVMRARGKQVNPKDKTTKDAALAEEIKAVKAEQKRCTEINAYLLVRRHNEQTRTDFNRKTPGRNTKSLEQLATADAKRVFDGVDSSEVMKGWDIYIAPEWMIR